MGFLDFLTIVFIVSAGLAIYAICSAISSGFRDYNRRY